MGVLNSFVTAGLGIKNEKEEETRRGQEEKGGEGYPSTDSAEETYLAKRFCQERGASGKSWGKMRKADDDTSGGPLGNAFVPFFTNDQSRVKRKNRN